jgi:hypothetical protein
MTLWTADVPFLEDAGTHRDGERLTEGRPSMRSRELLNVRQLVAMVQRMMSDDQEILEKAKYPNRYIQCIVMGRELAEQNSKQGGARNLSTKR